MDKAKEAGEVIARRSILGIVAGVAVFFAYALLLVASVALIGRWLDGALPETWAGSGWAIAAIIFGVLHAVLALLLFQKLKLKLPTPLFEYTRAEFQKDSEWLQTNNSGNENDSSP